MKDSNQTASLEIATSNSNQQVPARVSVVKHLNQIENFKIKRSFTLDLLDSMGWLFSKLVVVFFLVLNLVKLQNKKETQQKIEPPGPKGHFLVGLYPELASMSSPIEFTDQLWKTYMQETGICKYQLGGKFFYLISNPDYVKEIVNDPKTFARGPSMDGIRHFIGRTTIGATEGEAWKRKYDMLWLSLTPKKIIEYRELIITAGQKACEKWKVQGNHISDLTSEMAAIVMRVIGKILFNLDMEKEKNLSNALRQTLTQFFKIILASAVIPPRILKKLPVKFVSEFEQARQELHKELNKSIKQYIKEGKHIEPGNYYIDQLIKEYQQENKNTLNQAFIDDIAAIFIAGYETTSKLLTWIIFELAQNPVVVQKLYDEVDLILQGKEPGIEDLAKLTYLEKVIQETLRFYGPAGTSLRDVTKDTKLGPYHIEQGSYVQIAMRVQAKDPKIWAEFKPEEFNPDRFENELSKQISQYYFIPFYSGPHRCPGQHLVLLETKIIMSILLQQFEFKLLNKEPIKATMRFVMEPDRPIQLQLSQRQTFSYNYPNTMKEENEQGESQLVIKNLESKEEENSDMLSSMSAYLRQRTAQNVPTINPQTDLDLKNPNTKNLNPTENPQFQQLKF